MFTQLFGHYLLKENIVTAAQLRQALEAKNHTKVMLGALAIDAGYMSADQVERVHSEQKRVDKRFGDIAVDLGYMMAEQVGELLAKQKSADLVLGQALIDLGILSNKQFEESLASYKATASYKQDDLSDDLLIADLTKVFGLDAFGASKKFYIDYVLLLTRNLIRFVGDDFAFAGRAASGKCDILCAQDITGALPAYTAIAGNEAEFGALASRYAQEELQGLEYIQDGVGEFLNLQNGLLAVNLSLNSDIELGLLPPIFETSANLDPNKGLAITLLFSFGAVDFVVIKK